MEDLVFSDFCAEIGVDSIREYEQEYLKQQTELDKKRLRQQHACIFTSITCAKLNQPNFVLIFYDKHLSDEDLLYFINIVILCEGFLMILQINFNKK